MAFPLPRTIYDHTPRVVQIGTGIPKSKLFKFKTFCLEHHDFKEVVQRIWEQQVQETGSAKIHCQIQEAKEKSEKLV